MPVFQFRYGVLPWPLRQHYRIRLHRTDEVFEVTDVKRIRPVKAALRNEACC